MRGRRERIGGVRWLKSWWCHRGVAPIVIESLLGLGLYLGMVLAGGCSQFHLSEELGDVGSPWVSAPADPRPCRTLATRR